MKVFGVFLRVQSQKVSSSNLYKKDLRRNVRTKLRRVGGEQGIHLNTVKKSIRGEAKRRQTVPKVWMKVPRSNCDANTEEKSKEKGLLVDRGDKLVKKWFTKTLCKSREHIPMYSGSSGVSFHTQ